MCSMVSLQRTQSPVHQGAALFAPHLDQPSACPVLIARSATSNADRAPAAPHALTPLYTRGNSAGRHVPAVEDSQMALGGKSAEVKSGSNDRDSSSGSLNERVFLEGRAKKVSWGDCHASAGSLGQQLFQVSGGKGEDEHSNWSEGPCVVEDLSLPSSPTASCHSENLGNTSPAPDDTDPRQRRLSMDQGPVEIGRKPPVVQSSFQRRNFLPRDQIGLNSPQPGLGQKDRGSGGTPGVASPCRAGSPLFPGSPLPAAALGATPSLACGEQPPSLQIKPREGAAVSWAMRHLAGADVARAVQSAGSSPVVMSPAGGSPLFHPYKTSRHAPQQQQQYQQQCHQHQPSQQSPMHERRRSGEVGLRETVLVRTSSGHSGELIPRRATEHDETLCLAADAECLNFEDVESICQEKELEKDLIDGILIVPLPSSSMAKDAPEYVLYALFFSSDESPALPGDDSIKLLFPQKIQDWSANKSKAQSEGAYISCQPVKSLTRSPHHSFGRLQRGPQY